MSLLEKIPPLVSALAFGYGVGMAAPNEAVRSLDPSSRSVPSWLAGRPRNAPPPLAAPLVTYQGSSTLAGARESDRLARLREAQQGERGGSCEMEGPRESRWGSEANADDELDREGVDALSRLQLPDLKLTISRKTLRYVRFFARTERGRGMFEAWLRRSGRYQDLVQRELRERRLPEDLMWLAMIESGFDPRVKSPAGAVGLWQFMPATGAVYGLRQNKWLDERRNPRLATRAAAHHLSDLYLRFDDWNLALAAYNMGYEQLLDRIDRYNTADFNELVRQHALPDETSAYVPKIAAAAIIANNLQHFGFDEVKYAKAEETGEIAVPAGTSLKTIAKAAGIPLSTVKNLNPDFLAERVPPGRGGDWLVQLPPETLSKTQVTLPVLLRAEPAESVDSGVLDPVDLLGGRDFAQRRAMLEEGESLLHLLPPPKKRRSLRDGTDDDDDTPERSGRQVVMAEVKAGESLVDVARRFAADVEDVATLNNLSATSKPKTGAMLRIRVRKDVLAQLASKPAEPAATAAPSAPAPSPASDPAPTKADKRVATAPEATRKQSKSSSKTGSKGTSKPGSKGRN
jgi:membrane-bound lytic murein transglycosylase D